MNNTFRTSEFIDFNTGIVKLAPMTLINHLKRPWSLTDKILVFYCRVDVWHLGVAVQMLKEIESTSGSLAVVVAIPQAAEMAMFVPSDPLVRQIRYGHTRHTA